MLKLVVSFDGFYNNFMSESFYKDIFNAIQEGVVVCDGNNVIIAVNDYFSLLLGYEKNIYSGKNIEEFLNLNSLSLQHIKQSKIKNAEGVSIPVIINKSAFGEKFIYTVQPMKDLVCLNQAHIDFVSTVSHELRTPLTSIKGFADTILTSGDKLTKEQHNRFVSIIKSQVDRLTRLVENLLAVSKLEAEKEKIIYKSVNVKDSVLLVVSLIQNKYPNSIFSVDIPDNTPQIWADTDKFQQVLMNLIDNAAKYSIDNAKVTVKTGFSNTKENSLDIMIIDEGVGIPDENMSKIFNKFSRLDNPLTRQVQGTGLGLYITKTIVEKMNGNISVSKNIKAGKGVIFTITLPLVTAEVQTSQKFIQ